jgi:hypothetical protein
MIDNLAKDIAFPDTALPNQYLDQLVAQVSGNRLQVFATLVSGAVGFSVPNVVNNNLIKNRLHFF